MKLYSFSYKNLAVALFGCMTTWVAAYGESPSLSSGTQKTEWVFKTLIRDAGNEVSASNYNKNATCPQSALFAHHFKPTFVFTKRLPLDEFLVYELNFDKSGQIIDTATDKPTDWYGQMQSVQKNITKVVLKKKGCPLEIEFGYFNTKTQRLCQDAQDTLAVNKKSKGSKDFNACIDWAKYLDNPKRKEIDISIDTQDEFGSSPTSFLGFGRFKDVPKPIVGKDQSTWYCFANCPTGKPGQFQRN